MKVEIYSDVVCPWCYIGKRRWESALASFAQAERVEFVWKPFQLDPAAPRQPSPAFDAYAKKFGGPERAGQLIEQLIEVGAADGLDLRFDIAQRANTFDAHRLLWLAEREGDQDGLKEALLRAYFTDGLDVADHGVLAALAHGAGIDRERAERFLASDEGRAEVRREIDEGVQKGVTAVPTFVFNGQWGVPGAQEPATFLRVLERMLADEDEQRGAESAVRAEASVPADPTSGADCDDGTCAR